MIFGLETSPVPDGWIPVEAIGVVKCLDEDGDPRLVLVSSKTLSQWEAVGMLTTALDVSRDAQRNAFIPDDDDDD